MRENKIDNDVRVFFRYMIVGFVISSCRMDFVHYSAVEIVQKSVLAFWFNLIVGIFTGLAAMFSIIIYKEVKKNLRKGKHGTSLFTSFV